VGVVGYKIYRVGAASNPIKVVTTTTASDTGLSAGTNYCYSVSAYDAAGNESAQSSQQCAIPPSVVPPAANISGTWNTTETMGTNTCGETVGTIVYSTNTITHASGSNSFTLVYNGGPSYTGTISGTHITYSGAASNSDCPLGFNISVSLDLQAPNYTTATGYTDWTCLYSGGSCSGRTNISTTCSTCSGGSLTGTVSTFAGSAGVSGSANGTGSTARFNRPDNIATDGINLYVADSNNHTIRKIVIATGGVTTIAGSAGLSGSTDGTGSGARFYLPYGITTDGTNLYVADSGNHTIRKIVIATGVVTTLAGTAGVTGSTDGIGTAARFNSPYDITTDGTNLYVADTANFTVRKVIIATGAVTTFAGSAGIPGSTDGTGTAARFNYLDGITAYGTILYVSDSGNSTIRKIVITTGAVTTLAGSAGVTGSANGTGIAARFNYPSGIATDGINLYITDTNNQTIRKIVIATGVVTTLAGSAGVKGSADGTGTAARFNNPYGIIYVDNALYVGDYDNHTIRKIQ
jgi:hypothetical protein